MASRLQDVLLRGTAAARPLATAVAAGTLYYSTDTATTDQSDGTVWSTYADSGGGGGTTVITGGVGGLGLLLDGVDGQDGIDGLPGPRGADGSAGAIGPAGTHGYNGLDGAPGEDGQDGISIVGPPGPPGAASTVAGPAGAIGIDGLDGQDGQDGISIPGSQGPIGATGSIGPAGVNGYNGLDGNDGEQGEQGIPGGSNVVTGPASFFVSAIALLPDTSGNVFPKPSSIDDSNDRFPHEILAFKDSGTKIGASGSFTIPRNYLSGLSFTVIWKSTATSGDVVWDLETFRVALSDTLDPSADTDALTVTTSTNGTARDRNDSVMATTGIYVVDDIVLFKLSRDGISGSDTLAAEALVEGILVNYIRM